MSSFLSDVVDGMMATLLGGWYMVVPALAISMATGIPLLGTAFFAVSYPLANKFVHGTYFASDNLIHIRDAKFYLGIVAMTYVFFMLFLWLPKFIN